MAVAERVAFRPRDHATVNALWIGIQFQDAALLAIIVPAIVLRLTPQHHTSALAVLATLASVAVVLVPPLAGAFSDRMRRIGGDRRKEVALALVVDAMALVGMAYAASTKQLGTGLVAATIALTAASTIYQALLPEIVPRRAWGASSGVRGAMTLLGTIVGLIIAALLPPVQALFATAAIVLLGTLSLAAVPRERKDDDEEEATPAHAVVRDHHDLIVTLIARGWIVLGMTLLNTYVLYFFHDVLGVHDASLRTGLVAGAALIGAIASSVWAGTLSDRVDRRVVVALSGLPMTLAALGFALAPNPTAILLYAVLFGLGFGGVFSVGWALALDAIPALGDVARDLGIWAMLSSLPSIVAPALGGFIIAHAASPADGYRIMFGVSGASFAIGSLVVLKVRKRKPA
ncbi:MAG TPA: MFS transporter [Candidatus Limnocylindria bacterium]|jgi:MFS family permease|nr:MFS transporter [Candidatus Limnocylindria bacterium]